VQDSPHSLKVVVRLGRTCLGMHRVSPHRTELAGHTGREAGNKNQAKLCLGPWYFMFQFNLGKGSNKLLII